MDRQKAEKRAGELRAEINRHDHLYYVKASPEISDERYDLLRKELERIEDEFPGLVTPDSPTRRVGAEPRSELPSVRHLSAMLSLDSTTDPDEAREFDERLRGLVEKDTIRYTAEPKFDGLSVELVYEDGVLVRASTRGNGLVGEDITPNIRTVRSVPLKLDSDSPPALLSVRGEALMPLEGFRELNRRMTELGENTFANPRNAAAGSLRQLDPKVTASRPLSLYAYEVMTVEGADAPAGHTNELSLLSGWGFMVDTHLALCDGIEEAIEFHLSLGSQREDLPFEIDGVVIQADSKRDREAAGTKTRSPRWALAMKFQPRREVTIVEEIAVGVGRTGKLTPVALLRPVDVGGVTVSRATMHNAGEVARKDVRPGDRVRIERAGDVIPAVVERVPGGGRRAAPFSMPGECPACGSEVAAEGAYHFCTGGLSCPAQLKRGIEHFASKGGMDIEGLGEKTVAAMVDAGMVRGVSDLFRLEKGQLLELEGFADRSASNLVAAIAASRTRPLGRFIFALGIRNVGEHVSDILARRFGSMEALAAAGEEELTAIREVGPEVARSVRAFFASARNRSELEAMYSLGVSPEPPEEAGDEMPLEGKTFVFTGSLASLTRAEAKRMVQQLGGRVSSGVSGKTDYVVSGTDPGSKHEKAVRLGVAILSEEEFLALAGARGPA